MMENSVSFWTDGDSFTTMLRDFIKSGQFHNVIEILKDGGLDNKYILWFLKGEYKFIGDTRKGDLNFIKDDTDNENYLLTGWKTFCKSNKYNLYDVDYINDRQERRFDRHIDSLFSVINPQDFKELFRYDIIELEGYSIEKNMILTSHPSGVITKDGFFIECGYMGHNEVYELLYSLGLADDSCWTNDKVNIHVSSGVINGNMAHQIKYAKDYIYSDTTTTITKEQIKILYKSSKSITGFYGETMNISECIRDFIVYNYNNGAKYGNLEFLKMFYDFNIPNISKTPLKGKYCIRTSPTKSIAGLLNSKFDITSESVNEIYADWEKYKDIVKDNELFIFYQEYLEGVNGVAHYKSKTDFTFDLSKNRGDIVNGKSGIKSLDTIIYDELRKICSTLYDDLGEQIQLEFVVSNGVLYIVQLRIIYTPIDTKPLHNFDVIGIGKSFTKGIIDCELKDVLVVDEDALSEQLIGKKALIVRKDVEFSHILALSQSLRIPSLYAFDDTELPNEFKIDTTTLNGIVHR